MLVEAGSVAVLS